MVAVTVWVAGVVEVGVGGGSGDGTSGGRISRSGSSNNSGSTLKRIEVPTSSN